MNIRPHVFRIWTNAFWSPLFVLKRLLVVLFGPIPAAALCFAFDHGLIALAVLALGVWPLPFACTVGERGVTVSWLFVTETIPLENIAAVRVVADPRSGVLASRRGVLELVRRGASTVTIFGRPAVLHALFERIGALRE